MNDTENLAPLSLRGNKNVPSQKATRRKPLSQKLGKSTTRRRALGDITNNKLATKPEPLRPNKQLRKVDTWNDDDIPEPEIIPPPPPARPYQPAPLFSPEEMAELRREMETEEDDDSTDDFGRPFMIADPIPIPPPPFQDNISREEDRVPRLEYGLNDDYFSADQLFTKDELPALELA